MYADELPIAPTSWSSGQLVKNRIDIYQNAPASFGCARISKQTKKYLVSRLEQAPEAHGAIARKRWTTEDQQMATASDSDRLELAALRLQAKAARSITTLEVHRRSVVQEYAERIKMLRQAVMAIQQREQMGQLAIDGLDSVSLPQETMELIHDPLRGL
jgi:hypothetical protein